MATTHTIRCSSWDLAPRVVAYCGREAVSDLYHFEVGLQWQGELPFAPEDAVGEAITLEIDRNGEEPHRWHGIVDSVELALQEGVTSYWRVTFGPRLAQLALTEHSRVFTDVSVPSIVEAVLADEGLLPGTFAIGLSEVYASREHVCQFRESSLDFVRRLAERDGIHWYFQHGEEAEKLVFSDDSRAAAASRPEVRYVPLGTDGAMAGESLGRFRSKRVMLPRTVRLHDHDPMRPQLAVTGTASVARGPGGDVVRWGDHVLSPDDAARFARVRAEELLATRDVFEGTGPVIGLRPGFRFTLAEHPSLDGEYLVTALRHRARIAEASPQLLSALGLDEVADLTTQYVVDLTAVPATLRYRAPARTPWPRIAGVASAFVDGAGSSDYAQIDAEGRYRVRLHFDEGDTVDGSRSTWVRMLQPHSGNPQGIHFPLRKGTEVAIVFLGGDPDRPFILGVAPNPEKPSPVLSGNRTQNVIQTGGRNRLVLEDVAGGQSITESSPTASSFLHLGAGPKNLVLKTDGRGRTYTGGNFDVDVDAHKTEDVDGSVTETYQSTQALTVGGAVTETLRTSLTWTIAGPVTHTWVGPLTETVDGHVTESYGSTLDTTVLAGATTLTYAGGLTVTVAGDVTERFTASQTTTVDGPLTLIVASNVTERFGSVSRHVKGTYYLGVAGTYKVLTPVMDMKAPSWNVISNIAKKLVDASIKVESNSYTREVVNDNWFGVYKTSVTGLSLSRTHASVSVAGIARKAETSLFSVTGASASATGVRMYTGALMLLIGGPDVQ